MNTKPIFKNGDTITVKDFESCYITNITLKGTFYVGIDECGARRKLSIFSQYKYELARWSKSYKKRFNRQPRRKK